MEENPELLQDVPLKYLASYLYITPQSLEEHHGTNHGGHTGGIAYALHTGFLVGLLVATVVIYIVGTLFAIL